MKLDIIESTTESEIEDSDDITITDTSTNNNTRPGYTHRIYQSNDSLKQVNKTKSKITEIVHRGNDIAVRNLKQRRRPEDYNNFSQQKPDPHQKTKEFRELKKKSNSILNFLTAC